MDFDNMPQKLYDGKPARSEYSCKCLCGQAFFGYKRDHTCPECEAKPKKEVKPMKDCLVKYTQTDLDIAVDQARFEIMEAVKAAIKDCIMFDENTSFLRAEIDIKIEEIEEGFIGKSD